MNNARVMGEGHISGASYGKISVMGKAFIDEPVFCERLRIMGETEVKSDIKASFVKLRGEMKIDGKADFEQARIMGVVRSEGGWRCGTLKLWGELHSSGDCYSEHITVRGVISAKGLFSADYALFKGKYPSFFEDMGGQSLRVFCPWYSRLSSGFAVTAKNIEFDDIDIDYVKADTVRGHDIKIGRHCEIGLVEYSGTLTVCDGARIERQVKLP